MCKSTEIFDKTLNMDLKFFFEYIYDTWFFSFFIVCCAILPKKTQKWGPKNKKNFFGHTYHTTFFWFFGGFRI